MGDFTYEQLFDVVRRERSRDELQQLEDGFFSVAQAYVEEQSAIVRSMDVLTDEGEKVRTQLANAKKLLRELYDRREKKIMLLSLNKARTGSSIIDTSALLPGEKKLFDTMVDVLSTARGSIARVVTADIRPRNSAQPAKDASAASDTPKPNQAKPAPKPEEPVEIPDDAPQMPSEPAKSPDNGISVKITAAVPKFMGSDQQTFGPYEPGQEVQLPERIAQILVKKGRAEHA